MAPMVDNLAQNEMLARVGMLPHGSVVLLLGGTDVGKSTLARAIVDASQKPHPGPLLGKEREKDAGNSVSLLDLDVGQGSLSPPCAIGAAVVEGGVTSPAGMWFAGDVTPVRHIRDICEGSVRLIERLRRHDPALTVVDTCGLIGGKIGVVLKQRLILTIGPDVIVAIERSSELDPILTSLTRSDAPSTAIWKCAPSTEVGRKTSRFRRRYRTERLAAALEGARSVTFPLATPPKVDDLVGLVAGLIDGEGFCLGIGVVEAVGEGEVVVNTAVVEVEKVAMVKLGELRTRANNGPQV